MTVSTLERLNAPLAATGRIPVGQGVAIASRYANRHGLIAGATGTGKSVTLMTLAEGFCKAGVPVFMADVKGDLARLGACNAVRTLDVFGEAGDKLSLRIDSLGPDLLARMLGLSDAQRGALDVAFELARTSRQSLATLDDLKRLLSAMAADHKAVSVKHGLVSPTSIAAIQRSLITLEREGASKLFGQRTFDVAELITTGTPAMITLLDSVRLMRSPTLYAATLMFILQDLYDRLPEVGDLAKPRLVLFFDEAHLIFTDLAPALLQRIERAIRLIRSKGVGVYFASQSPLDIPPTILGQLGNRIQHALRGATIADQRAMRATAETLPINPKIDAFKAISSMGVGQALVSTIGENGNPQPVDLVKIVAPACMFHDMPIKVVERHTVDQAASPTFTPSHWKGLAGASAVILGGAGLFVEVVRLLLGL